MPALQQLIAIAVRIAAAFLFVSAVSILAGNISLLSFGGLKSTGWWTIFWWALLFAPLGIAVLLWFFPLFISRFLYIASDSGLTVRDAALEQTQTAALTVIGIAILALHVPDLISWATFYLRMGGIPSREPAYAASFLAKGIGHITVIVFGIWLTLGASGIIEIVNRVRGR